MKIKCSYCGKEQNVTYLRSYAREKNGKKYKRGCVYRDADGRSVYGKKRCYDCHAKAWRRLGGWTSRDNSKHKIIKVAVDSEKYVEAFFRDKLGFTTKRTAGTGPDVVCKMGDLTWAVEVKRATLNGSRWRVGKIMPARKKDDLVAIILPNGKIYIDSMKEHLSHCVPSDGSRAVWPIIKEFGLEPLPT